MKEYINNFINYEITKLEIAQADYTNMIIILFFFFLVILTMKRKDFNENDFIGFTHTEQLKGVAIFFVCLGHLWVHVSKLKAEIIFSGDAVSLFLLLSGFGLAISSKNRRGSFKEFFLKRIKKVLVPYWAASVIILSLDYLFLKRTLQIDSVVLTFLGINIRLELQLLDYVRWFVTFILFWYVLFYIFFIKYKSEYSSLYLFVISFALLPLHYYVLHFDWYHFFSFPAGCLLAVYYEKVRIVYKREKPILIGLSLAGIIYVLLYKIFMSHENIHAAVAETIPNILLTYISEGNALILNFSILFLFGCLLEKGYYSKLLEFLGKYSYEIFLLHGVFLIKYNPFIAGHNPFEVFLQFFVYFLFVTGLSMVSNRLINSGYEIK